MKLSAVTAHVNVHEIRSAIVKCRDGSTKFIIHLICDLKISSKSLIHFHIFLSLILMLLGPVAPCLCM
jgi:hypothetical protein